MVLKCKVLQISVTVPFQQMSKYMAGRQEFIDFREKMANHCVGNIHFFFFLKM